MDGQMNIIGEIQKNSKEKIIISINEYEGHKYIDLRVYYEDNNTLDWKPTKKGISFSSVPVSPSSSSSYMLIKLCLVKPVNCISISSAFLQFSMTYLKCLKLKSL